MKSLALSTFLLLFVLTAKARDKIYTYPADHTIKPTMFPLPDSIKLQTANSNAYYQKTFKVDSGIKVSSIYTRVLEFMAAKNFQQNYGYEQEGKLIFTTAQDLNITQGTAFENYDTNPMPYTVQFAFSVDMKNGRYRCTISNVVFFLPSENGTRRTNLFEVYEKMTGNEPRRVKSYAKSLIDSFEKYLIDLTNGLYTEVDHKADIYNSKF